MNVAVFVSGGGTNLQALIDAKAAGRLPAARLCLVVASKPGVYALQRAEKAGIPTAVVCRRDYADAASFDAALLALLREKGVEAIVLAGYLSIVGRPVIEAYRDKILNVHPSLIPSFCGPGYYGLRVHEAALPQGVHVRGLEGHTHGVRRNAAVARRAVQLRHVRALLQLADDGVLAPAASNHQYFHGNKPPVHRS